MIDLNAMKQTVYDGLAQDLAVITAKQEYVPEAVMILEECLNLVDPDDVQLTIGGWYEEPPRVYASLHLYFNDKESMKSSAQVLEALVPVAPVECWKNSDHAASITRTFVLDPLPGTEVTLYVHWSVADAPGSGCTRRLVRVDRVVNEREESVYEIVCAEELPK